MSPIGPILSDHARRRLAQRNLSLDDIYTVCQFGVHETRAGLNCYFFGKRQLQEQANGKQFEHLVGITVLCCPRCHYVVTAYRNQHGIKDHRHKTKYARPHTTCQCSARPAQ